MFRVSICHKSIRNQKFLEKCEMIYSIYTNNEGGIKNITKASKDLITNASHYLFREHSQSEADLSTR